MAFSMNLWKVDDDKLTEITRAKLGYEERLENWIVKDPSILGIDLIPIGRQVVTDLGGRIDLLCIDRDGDIAILELKRDKTPREVVAQSLEYASWIRNLSHDELNEITKNFCQKDLTTVLAESFDQVPDNINSNHSMIIVASSLDESSERIVQYLADEYNVNINIVFFTFFRDGKKEFLGRAWLADPEQVEEKATVRRKGVWSGYWFVNVGEGPSRNWDDNVRYGYLGAGGGVWYSRGLKHLQVNDKIFAYMSGLGYVGYGQVIQEAIMIKDFRVSEENKTLLELPLKSSDASKNSTDPDLSEWVVGVNWIKTFPREEAKTFKGIFAKQHIACKLRDETTVSFLIQQFGINVV